MSKQSTINVINKEIEALSDSVKEEMDPDTLRNAYEKMLNLQRLLGTFYKVRRAPGRRIILVRADNKAEALAATKLMLKQLEQLPDSENEEPVVQSFYIDKTGVCWFG